MRFTLTLILFLIYSPSFAQTSADFRSLGFQDRQTGSASKPFVKRAFKFALGTKSADGLAYLPVSLHLSTPETARNSANHMISLTRNGITGATFINSFGDRTWSLGFSRTLFVKNRIGVEYSAGLMVGYKGKLAGSFPVELRSLFEGNLNPYLVVSPYYKISEKLEARLLYGPPNVILFGMKYLY